MPDLNARYTPKGEIEGRFRRGVRYALDLDVFVTDEQIVEEILRLKRIEKRMSEQDPQGREIV